MDVSGGVRVAEDDLGGSLVAVDPDPDVEGQPYRRLAGVGVGLLRNLHAAAL